jgi:hypothetical protein
MRLHLSSLVNRSEPLAKKFLHYYIDVNLFLDNARKIIVIIPGLLDSLYTFSFRILDRLVTGLDVRVGVSEM